MQIHQITMALRKTISDKWQLKCSNLQYKTKEISSLMLDILYEYSAELGTLIAEMLKRMHNLL